MDAYFLQDNQYNVKHINKHAALDLIRFSPGGISRARLAEKLGISRAAVTVIIKDLMTQNIIVEGAAHKHGNGRPSILLRINPQGGYVAGIDMGVTHLHIIIANLNADVLEEKEEPFDIARGPQACLEQVEALLVKMLAPRNLQIADLDAIGLDIPGPIAQDTGIIIAPPIMPGWDRFPVKETLSKRWGIPISINNDAEMGALGEWAYGAGREYENIIYIKVGSGIGAGLILNNRIYRGANGSAGEIGHITVKENGPLCRCGNRGCLEALAGGQAIAEQGRQLVRRSGHTQLVQFASTPEALSARDIAIAARRGDLAAQQIFRRAGNYIGIGIASLINLFNPDIVIVGGGIANVGDMILEPIRQTALRRALTSATQNLSISTALLGRRSSSMGAVVQALNLALHQMA